MDSAYDGGGWTLVAVSSDDGQDTWTWNNRNYWDTDTTTFGSLTELNRDFKSPAHHDVRAQDVMFLHAPSGVWANTTMSACRMIVSRPPSSSIRAQAPFVMPTETVWHCLPVR